MVAASLTSTPHMISATITALSRLIFDFHTDLAPETTSNLIGTINVFLDSNDREIVKSAIGFVKVAIVTLPAAQITPHLPDLIPSLLTWSSDHKNHFKLKIRHIFERLIRKFGLEAIAAEVGEDNQKFVNNIRKRQQRQKRKKGRGGETDGKAVGDASDDEVRLVERYLQSLTFLRIDCGREARCNECLRRCAVWQRERYGGQRHGSSS